VDVIGSDSLLNEYELIKIVDEIFGRLKLSVIIKINNRKILAGIAAYVGAPDRITDITIAIDKLDKIGLDAVNDELKNKGLTPESVSSLQPVLKLDGNTSAKLEKLTHILSGSEIGLKGIEEIRTLFEFIEKSDMQSSIELDLTLARGLNYYTGAIIEVKSRDVSIGSICGGGRYDNLTGVFGMDGVSGVGISFGADRIYDVINQLSLFENIAVSSTEVLVVNFGSSEAHYAMKIRDLLHKKGIRTELYPDPVKLKKQMSYADSKKIPYIIIAGENEVNENSVTLKIMSSGEQKKIMLQELNTFVEHEIRKNVAPINH
jgi:histidyl-tRNA synthetase